MARVQLIFMPYSLFILADFFFFYKENLVFYIINSNKAISILTVKDSTGCVGVVGMTVVLDTCEEHTEQVRGGVG